MIFPARERRAGTMAREIPLSKRLEVVKLYFEGLSYDDIVKRTGVAKGTVAAIVEELKEGRFPQFEHLTDLLNELRDMVVALRKSKMSSTEAVYLFTIVRRLIPLGVEPSQLESWIGMCRSVPEEGFPRSQIIQAATRLAKMEREGKSYEEAIDSLNNSLAEAKRLEEKVSSLRVEEAQLVEKRKSLSEANRGMGQEVRRLIDERKEAEKRCQELLSRCHKLEQDIEQRKAALAPVEKKEGELNRRLPQLERKIEVLQKELADGSEALRKLENAGFTKDDLDKLNGALTEIAERRGKDDVAARFFAYLDDYDSLLEMEYTKDSLTLEVENLAKQRDSLAELGKKWGLAADEVTEGIAVLKDLRRRGVLPAVIVSYRRALTEAGADPQSLQKLVEEFGGLEQVLSVKQSELKGLTQTLETKAKALEELKGEETRVKGSITAIRDAAVNHIESMVQSTNSEVEKLCRELQENITRWGEVRAEMGKCQEELKLARYFAKLPLTDEALSRLVEDIGASVVGQYLTIASAWCQRKLNLKLRPPKAILKKYYSISEYTEVELADIITWALLALMEGVSSDQGRASAAPGVTGKRGLHKEGAFLTAQQ
jgi:DNA repair exonuclease SbcCD ATPase subunit